MAKGIQDERYQAVISALRAARNRLKLSQAEVAERLGQRQQYVSKYEVGERRLDIVEFLDAAQVLEIDWQKLLQNLPRREAS